MKVKIMDYETAKAEVLTREQNPRLANDKRVWGVDKTWKGWGQVRDVYKDAIYSQDLEDGYAFPNYLIVDVTPEDALRYGEVIVDEEFVPYGRWHVRVRIISYSGSVYYHKMVDGEVIDFKEIGLAMK